MADDSFLKEQRFEDDCNGTVTVINHFEDDDLLKENYMQRMDDNNHGMSKLGNMRKVAGIPKFLFDNDPELQEYNRNVCLYPNYARRVLRHWLSNHPEYLCSNGGI